MNNLYGGIIVSPLTSTSEIRKSTYELYLYKGKYPDLTHFTAFQYPDQVWQCEQNKLPLPESELWIAGVKMPDSKQEISKKLESIYTVNKPWGKEYWLSGEHKLYCFKRIVIRAGHRTSLQYHTEKSETNIILKGSVRLHYNEGDKLSPKISIIEVVAPATIDIPAGLIHRMEAITDLDFIEISTPQINDVIRLSDDTARPNGRIDSEHGKNAT